MNIPTTMLCFYFLQSPSITGCTVVTVIVCTLLIGMISLLLASAFHELGFKVRFICQHTCGLLIKLVLSSG